MNRRDFLRYGVSCLMGILLGEGGNLLEASPCRQPMIYKRFFQFTEYERRQATEYLVIHHTGRSLRGQDQMDAQTAPDTCRTDQLFHELRLLLF